MKNFWQSFILQPFNSFKKPRTITIAAMLIALNIVLTRFLSIQTTYLRIGFGFLPVAIFSALFGAIPGAIAAVLGDLLGFYLYPTGPYFYGFTVSALILGAIYGIAFFKKKVTFTRILITTLIVTVFIEFLLNTYWLSILWSVKYSYIMWDRLIKAALMAVVQTSVLTLFFRYLFKRIDHRQINI